MSTRLLRAGADDFFVAFPNNATTEECPTCPSCECHVEDHPPLPTVVPRAPPPRSFNKKDQTELEWSYLSKEKDWPYIGSTEWKLAFPEGSRKYYNSLAVFPHDSDYRMHGLVGIFPNGSRSWQPAPMPPPISQIPGGKELGLKDGGFYMNLSNALPLDRDPVDGRDAVCVTEKYDITKMPDVSIVITFYDEAPSTLLRSVHSVLNRTPAPLLTEIILVDDHSDRPDNLPGSILDKYVRLLPKTKIMRMGERRGLVWARLAGAKIAKAPVLVILDSHIEVNDGWLEPQLQRLLESPKSIVFPQIMAINSEDFSYLNQQGIGCFLSFKWAMQEKASLTGKISTTDAIPSPSMAGGLFTVYRDWFWELGGYDEEFGMWGAENVEMGFRTWMCGGRMECTPCARVYHIYRKGGHAYTSPPEALWKNRLRTARIWTDEFYQVAERFNHHPGFDIGPLDKMLELKEKLHCKSFRWFLETIDPTHELQSLDDVALLGEFKNQALPHLCVDSLAHNKVGDAWGHFSCHGSGGTQGFMMTKSSARIRTFTDEYKCLGVDFKLTDCKNPAKDSHWTMAEDGQIFWSKETADEKCLALVNGNGVGNKNLQMVPCNSSDLSQKWSRHPFLPDPDFKLPTFSKEYLEKKRQDKLWMAGYADEEIKEEAVKAVGVVDGSGDVEQALLLPNNGEDAEKQVDVNFDDGAHERAVPVS